MSESQSIFSTPQQDKFQQLQLEIAALEQQVENLLREQLPGTNGCNLRSPILLIQVSDRAAKTGIKLTRDTAR